MVSCPRVPYSCPVQAEMRFRNSKKALRPLRFWSATLLSFVLSFMPNTAMAEVGCIDLPKTLSAINTALYEVLLEDATQLAQDAKDGLLCQTESVNPLVLATIFQLGGALHTFQGQEHEARMDFATAVSISPTQNLDPILGEDAASIYQSVREEVLKRIPGKLEVHFIGESWVDGRLIASGEVLEITPGFHLLQWRNPGESMQARRLDISGAELRQVGLGLGGEGALAAANAQKKAPTPIVGPNKAPSLQKTMMIGGSGMLVTGVALMLKARSSFLDFQEPNSFQSKSDVDQLRSSTNALAVLGMSSAAVGAGLVGLSVVPVAGLHVSGSW